MKGGFLHMVFWGFGFYATYATNTLLHLHLYVLYNLYLIISPLMNAVCGMAWKGVKWKWKTKNVCFFECCQAIYILCAKLWVAK